ncbi:LOG family protein [Salinisphaera sp.]|uniref:LOG family protein n=1 Tax=Salinisphaera sp. TaxID=1914330 RepID=UPI000C4529CB|nr:LOG family protein [Salinisphaera sp.]MAS10054.1 lysine decarboxylase [Salinisphaera sp.]|tara:strand:+ start:1437 stop:2177 length:741 start_codon:yes stop_codon:yes gene_type:complete
MTKAYNDAEFMLSEEARPLRLLSEYLEPRTRLAELNVHRALIFWGSARLRPREDDPVDEAVDFYAQARELAARMTRWTMETHAADEHYYVCTGGGPGIMEAANRGAADVNRELSMGYNIELPHEQGSNAYISDALNFEFHYFFMRKFWFMNVAKALIIFPGGFGTMDELFEMLTLIQTGKQPRIPVVLYGKDFWDRLINFDVFVELGLIAERDIDLFYRADSVDDAFDFLTDALAQDTVTAQSRHG